jgi:hypothetical protein
VVAIPPSTIQNDKNPRPATNKATLFLKVALLFLIIFADSFTGENVFDFCTESLTELSLAPIVSAIGARDFFAEAFFEESRKNPSPLKFSSYILIRAAEHNVVVTALNNGSCGNER